MCSPSYLKAKICSHIDPVSIAAKVSTVPQRPPPSVRTALFIRILWSEATASKIALATQDILARMVKNAQHVLVAHTNVFLERCHVMNVLLENLPQQADKYQRTHVKSVQQIQNLNEQATPERTAYVRSGSPARTERNAKHAYKENIRATTDPQNAVFVR